jgi:hypothetical protein
MHVALNAMVTKEKFSGLSVKVGFEDLNLSIADKPEGKVKTKASCKFSMRYCHPDIEPDFIGMEAKIPTEDHCKLISSSVTTIMTKLSAEVTFDMWDSVPAVLAQALLRTVDLHDPSLALCAVDVLLIPAPGQNLDGSNAVARLRSLTAPNVFSERSPGIIEQREIAPLSQGYAPFDIDDGTEGNGFAGESTAFSSAFVEGNEPSTQPRLSPTDGYVWVP